MSVGSVFVTDRHSPESALADHGLGRLDGITDEARNHLYNTLREKLGAQDAATMMELLPPAGWADVATKRDLDHLEQRLDQLERGLEHRIEQSGDKLRAEVSRQLLNQTFALLAAFATIMAIAVSAVRLG